jgi:DNA-binding XRE family transcriptional regulator
MIDGAQIRKARLEKNWTQGRLAQASGIDRQRINAIERGKHPLTREAAEKIAGALGLAEMKAALCASCPLGAGPSAEPRTGTDG